MELNSLRRQLTDIKTLMTDLISLPILILWIGQSFSFTFERLDSRQGTNRKRALRHRA